MSNRELAAKYRNPNERENLDFENPVGTVDEEELKALAGARIPITPSSWVCGFVTAALCPTTACTSDC
ncbi:class II lanthipeptide, LchA2/BrtA2 family [Amphibacillus sp. MSJ-3]|uniref:class II lanthipeptide, LchA2/BrtA2 family n=1 Tax=Amphibacillus sp. MSJ-3 TaxID=2841505 RepID=UPI001C0EFC27|nr:class II lanthipeptide, LchA2/BrtA2 family [Amphibacillus sp. MSJ-3]MBU5594545.1 class II lanthipeptide, LchA2/BrtA2 family [Amphibacillus sp. MSJ-3]